jgi:hypothetical protein
MRTSSGVMLLVMLLVTVLNLDVFSLKILTILGKAATQHGQEHLEGDQNGNMATSS